MTRHQRTDEEPSALWRSLEDLRIETQGATLTFSARLARENGWSPARAEAVFFEYRRFLYLAAVSGRPVTPSEAVDQAWHLHLSYTRHYWDVLCARILGRPFHHEPTAGGREEAARYRGQYEATLWLYRETFGAAPPVEIWPDAGARFAARAQWVDRSRYWLVPKIWVGSGSALTATLMLGACTMLAAAKAVGDDGLTAIVLSLAIAVVIGGSLAMRSARKKDEGGGCGGGGSCSGDSCGCGSGCGGGCGGCGG